MFVLPGPLKQEYISLNQREYGVKYNYLRFIEPEVAFHAADKRNKLLTCLDLYAYSGYNNTKIDCNNLSPGCQQCGNGSWSCLFINNMCNCSCFYCPTEQQTEDIPSTNNLIFPRPHDYVDYLSLFEFTGASISGGEPFLTFDRSLDYLKTIKKSLREKIYCWLYTNGTLVTKDKLLILKDCGLNEIRFDISATHYSLKYAELAIGIIDTVTVEIPSVPEDMFVMQQKLREIKDAGISHLNLHQLRLTPYNFKRLLERDYTFLHGAKVTVLESELCALELLVYNFTNNINMPINYCSFAYKNRFQGSAARKRAARIVKHPYEEITEPGYLKRTWIEAKPDVLQSIMSMLSISQKEHMWHLNSGDSKLFVHPSLLPLVKEADAKLFLRYYEASIVSNKRSTNPHRELYINDDLTVYIESKVVSMKISLQSYELNAFNNFVKNINPGPLSRSAEWDTILHFEKIPVGLQEYF